MNPAKTIIADDKNIAPRLAVVVDRYPCLSESFVRRELDYLQSFGFTLSVVTCSPPAAADQSLLPEGSFRVIRSGERVRPASLAAGARDPQMLAAARKLFKRGFRATANAVRASLIAASVLQELEAWKPDMVHAHFLGMPSVVGCLLSHELEVPFTISAHARDIFVSRVDVPGVCSRARFVATCSRHAQESLRNLLPLALQTRVVYIPHDVDCDPVLPAHKRSSGSEFRLLSVCRLAPKKGVDVVLHALSLLRQRATDQYRYRIAGDGPEFQRLVNLARELKLDSVEFLGALPPEKVREELTQANAFVLGTRRMPDGDRDGIPNAMLEAMAIGLPVIVSDAGGVSEVIKHRETGWLLPANDPEAFANAIHEAATNDLLRQAVVTNAHAVILNRFAGSRNREILARKLAEEIQN